MNKQEAKSDRTCYTCGKEIKDIPGKYFCSKECWVKYGEKHYPKTRHSTKYMVERLKEMGKKPPDIVEEAKVIFKNGL